MPRNPTRRRLPWQQPVGATCTASTDCCSNNCIARGTDSATTCKCLWRAFSAGKGRVRHACNSASAWGQASKLNRSASVSCLNQMHPCECATTACCIVHWSLQAALRTSSRLVPRAATIISAAVASAETSTLVSGRRRGKGGRWASWQCIPLDDCMNVSQTSQGVARAGDSVGADVGMLQFPFPSVQVSDAPEKTSGDESVGTCCCTSCQHVNCRLRGSKLAELAVLSAPYSGTVHSERRSCIAGQHAQQAAEQCGFGRGGAIGSELQQCFTGAGCIV